MGGVQSGTHNLGDALWVQERQKQKGYRDGNGKYESNGPPQSQSSTQERRKLLKRTRSLAVITEDESNRSATSCAHHETLSRFGTSYDTSSLQHHHRAAKHPQQQQQHHHHQQLIPRAKLIDRNSLKDRLSKSQQHLSDCYERLNGADAPALRACQSRSVCGLYNSLPPPLDSLPDPLPYTRAGGGLAGCRTNTYSATLRPDRINILKWPESPRRYRSVQDLNSVSGLVEIIEDNNCGWLNGVDEENRSLDCIYTQVKRKRKEHRSLDSILFEDDSDELEYFDVLNLLPLSNVRLEIDEADASNNNVIQERSNRGPLNREPKSNPTVISVSVKKSNPNSEKCSKHHSTAQITEIEEVIPTEISSNEKSAESKSSDSIDTSMKKSSAEKGVTSFSEIAREKQFSENTSHSKLNNLDSLRNKNNKQTQDFVETYYSKTKQKFGEKIDDNRLNKKESLGSHLQKTQNNKDKLKVEETEDTKSLWISDNEETEEMSRRPLVIKIVDNDVTKVKNLKKSISINVNSSRNDAMLKENIYGNITNYQKFNKPDLINDHIYETKNSIEVGEEREVDNRLSVENARNFFEKKNTDNELLTNRESDNGFEKIVKETSNMLGKTCNTVKGSLGFEARSESSDLGLGSEIGSDVRRLSVDENTNVVDEKSNDQKHSENCNNRQYNDLDDKNQKNCTNLTRSRSCIDSIECQDSDEPEFDHVRYKILKSHMFSKNIFNNAKKDVTYEGLMEYLREYSFQDLLMDNNVVIIEPVRAEIDRKPSFNDSKFKSTSNCKVSTNSLDMTKSTDMSSSDEKNEKKSESQFKKTPRQSSLRKHFFYQPIRVNRELNDDELPDPDTVRNVRRMFEETLNAKLKTDSEISRDCNARKSVSMKDLRTIEGRSFECGSEKATEVSRSRCSSRAKDLTKMFENMEKASSPSSMNKDDTDCSRGESKTKTIAQSFEARSGHTSPSNSNSPKIRLNRYQRQLPNWDAGSVSSGVSSDYPDTDAGSAPQCTSSEDEELYYHEDDDERYEGHYVSPDVLRKIREYGTSVTYYGGKVVNTCNGPLICPMVCKNSKGSKKSLDYVKFRLVKSNSCDSRLELTGRVVDNRNKCHLKANREKGIDLRQFTIDETPSIEITLIEQENAEKANEKLKTKEEKREPPVVIGLEPKKEEDKNFKADFKLGKLEDSTTINRFTPSALSKWQINETTWKGNSDFGKMEFEEFEVLEDSLNEVDH